MNAGDLDRRVQVMRAAVSDDGFQTRFGDYQPHGDRQWAAKNDISDREKYIAAGVGRVAESRFLLRWSRFSAGIIETDRLVCEGVVFDIVGIKEVGRREGVEITAARVRDAG